MSAPFAHAIAACIHAAKSTASISARDYRGCVS